MKNIVESIQKVYGKRIRHRACGVCQNGSRYLLIDHQGLGTPHFWSPVGGGIEVGETAQQALVREFMEETNLRIKVLAFLCVYEFIKPPLHAYEFFFFVQIVHGKLRKGLDPEMTTQQQTIQEVKWLTTQEIQQIPTAHKHPILDQLTQNSSGKLHSFFY